MSRRARSHGLILELIPIKVVVILMSQAPEQNEEKFSKVHVIWGFLKPQAATVVEIISKFRWIPLNRIMILVDNQVNRNISLNLNIKKR